mgnify:CR=1 FL=1
MSCNCSNCSLINVFYKCDINDYRIVDENDNLVKVISDHEITEDDEEINIKEKIKYCQTCNKIFRFPDIEENYIFKPYIYGNPVLEEKYTKISDYFYQVDLNKDNKKWIYRVSFELL